MHSVEYYQKMQKRCFVAMCVGITICLLGIAGVAFGQTVDELQAQIDSIRAAALDSGMVRAKADVDSIISNRAKLIDFGVIVVKHHADSMWVDIDLPVSTEEKADKKVAMKMFYQLLLSDYKARADDVPHRLRVRKDRAKAALKWLDSQL